jgi:putative oxygen-independent coproporphyrinogen III oxidase
MLTESPDSVAVAESATEQVAAYVHIPFCRRVCPYCDFAVVAGTGLADRYAQALIAEIQRAPRFDRPLDAVAFGGGTPTALPVQELAAILEVLERSFGFAPEVEISIEANPEDLDSDTAHGLRTAGFNRVSLGVQSFDDDVLQRLGRVHSATQAAAAITTAQAVFDSVNVDLIFGADGETLESWRSSLETALGTGVDHLSAYSLTVERGTALSRAVAAGAAAPDPDLQAEEWLMTLDMASVAGLVRYETSNYARPGHQVLYNLITWGQGEYEAFGNGAHRHRTGVRSWNIRRVDRYVEAVEVGVSPTSGEERPGSWEQEVERVMLGLRRAAGVRAGAAGDALMASADGEALAAAGVIEMVGDRLVVARPLLGDEVSRRLLALPLGDC